MPRVSILVTCYNHMRYLPEALEAVFRQSYSDYELIALDDGSTDGTREWLSARPEPIRLVFNEANLGTYASLNVGLSQATGEFVAILNDDDLWGPDKLKRQVEMMDADPRIGLVHTNGWFIDGEGARIEDPRPLGFTFPFTATGDVLPALIDHNQIITSSALVRRECFDRCGGFDPSFYGCGDWHMWLRVARSYHIGYVDEPLTFYRVHGSNACLDDTRMNADGIRIRDWITTWQNEELERKNRQPGLLHAFAHNWACLGTERTWAGDSRSGRKAYAESIKVMPNRVKSYLRWALTFLPRRVFRSLQ